MMKRKIICLVPVKNEAWILNIFLQATSLWADHIIILDQRSTDSSVEIAKSFEKVILFNNDSENYNELERQRYLIQKARELFGLNTILFALDADEILVNFENNDEWEAIHELTPGTAIYLPWLNVLPGNSTYFNSVGGRNVFAYIEDGREHIGSEMHSPRVPVYSHDETVFIDSIKVLHYQFSVRERQLAKHRWYECLEKVKYPQKDSINIYRMYHHIDLPHKQIHFIPDTWCELYAEKGIILKSIQDDGEHWWDKELCSLLIEQSAFKFRKQYIWYIDWNNIYNKYFSGQQVGRLKDPRSVFDKVIHAWLKASQPYPNLLINRIIAKLVRLSGW